MKKRLPITIAVVSSISLILIAAFLLLFSQRKRAQDEVPKKVPVFAYGIPVDSLDVVPGKVKERENLSMILSPVASGQLIDQIARTTMDVYDVRKIRPGQVYSEFFTKDSLRRLEYFVLEINDTAFVVYDVRDSLRTSIGYKKTTRAIRTASGSITSSLIAAFQEKNLDMDLAYALADVYAWTVDFYGLQEGDRFKTIYEEVSVEGRTIRSDKILAALFESSGRQVYAFPFKQQGNIQYFDESGKSLRRSFLKAPLHFSRISSRFSGARMHPILKIRRPHYGVDYAAPKGTPVVSLGDGRVEYVGWKGGYGKFISIRHNSVYTTTYAHLSGFASGIRGGAHVRQGQLVGFVGSTGLATGPHLDFRVYKNGSPCDPLRMESPPSDPVKKEVMPSYLGLVNKMRSQLDSIRW